ncbi:hypothetical protein MFLAVUS_002447 [Mucor flavus]|uniref:Uncharacterized protein n=1 Tax=Mucor flavus TaxID=439312 RepID=A0ABP9YQB1_9FUNG
MNAENDFGAVSSGLSIAHVDRPHSKFTVNTWYGKLSKSEAIKSDPQQFLTTILYKSNEEIHCGLSKDNGPIEDDGDVYIDNIKQYTLNEDQANKELQRKKEGLTIRKVVADYLKIFHELAIDCLTEQKDFCESYKFEEDFKLENLGYCLSCPTSLNGFFADCFVEAGITEKDNLVFVSEAEATAFHCLSLDRLTTKIVPDQTYFVYDIGHSSFRVSKIEADSIESFSEVKFVSEEQEKGSMALEKSFENYLTENKSTLNLDESIISILVEQFVKEIKSSFIITQDDDEVQVESINKLQESEKGSDEEGSDEESSEEESSEEESSEEEFGDIKSNKVLIFKLQDNPPKEESSNQVDALEVGQDPEEEVSPFFPITDVNNKHINITAEDLEKHVFSPYIDYLVKSIMTVDEDNKNSSKIFLSGRYSSDPNFIEKLHAQKNGKFQQFVSLIEDTNIDAVSLGAVSSGLKSKDIQIPFFSEKNFTSPSPGSQKNKGSNENLRNEHMSKEEEDEKIKTFDFIVGIDFGTTFTGCSYANPNDVHVNDLKAIYTIETGWPGGNAIAFGKTPTLLMYDKKMKPKLWGQEAKQNIERHKDLTLLGHFKLFLSPEAVDAQYGQGNEDIKMIKEANDYIFAQPTDTSQTQYKMKKNSILKKIDAVQVIADYLKEVKEHVIRHIVKETKFKKGKKGLTSLFKSSENDPKIQFVLTVPAMWTTSARETMVQAAIKATIIKKDEVDDLRIISEPEAAALFCEKKYSGLVRDPENPNADSDFIVCDAGGGTVDLVTFRLTRNQKNGDPMICQIGSGIGDTCGSTYIDRAFKDYLLKFYKDIGLEVNDIDKSFNSVMDDFISNIKCPFQPDSGTDRFRIVKLPAERIITSIPNTKEAKQYTLTKKNTELKIKLADIKEKIFDPIITKILALIQQQLDQASVRGSAHGSGIKAILLVGGFSRNPYLQQRIQEEYRGKYDVKMPEEGVAAISRGAVSYGLNPRLISSKIAGQSVALEVRAPFNKSEDDSLDKKVDRFDKKVDDETITDVYSKNRLEYFVRQSDDLRGESLTLFNRIVTVDYPNDAVIAIFACDFKEKDNEKFKGKDDKESFKEKELREAKEKEDKRNWRYVSRRHTKILEEIIKLPEVEEIAKGTPIYFNVGLKMDDIGATVTIECKDEVINRKIEEVTNGKKTSLKVIRKCDLIVVKNKKTLIEYSLAKNAFSLNNK